MKSIDIREAKTGDIACLLKFEQGIVEAERPFDDDIKEKNAIYYDLTDLIHNENSVILVATNNGELVGCGYAKIKSTDQCMKRSKYTYLGFMYVKPSHRRQGISKVILNSLMSWSKNRGVDDIRLEVYEGNEAAIQAYKVAGFMRRIVEMQLVLD